MKMLKNVIWEIIKLFPIGKKIYDTRITQTPITLKYWFFQKVLGFNNEAYWPVHFTSRVSNSKNIFIGIDTCPGYMNNCYIQGLGGIHIGDYTQIAPSVSIISSNHDLYDSRIQIPGKVIIGKHCWLAVNSVILPNVVLGDFTIVAAGSVVTKSFSEGNCVIGGIPAKLIKKLDPEKCIPFKNSEEYHGYISKDKFEVFRKRHLTV